jgi:hypothetical protein
MGDLKYSQTSRKYIQCSFWQKNLSLIVRSETFNRILYGGLLKCSYQIINISVKHEFKGLVLLTDKKLIKN